MTQVGLDNTVATFRLSLSMGIKAVHRFLTSKAIAFLLLCKRGCLNRWVFVPEQDWSKRRHVIDISVSVHVDHLAPFTMTDKLWVPFGVWGCLRQRKVVVCDVPPLNEVGLLSRSWCIYDLSVLCELEGE